MKLQRGLQQVPWCQRQTLKGTAMAVGVHPTVITRAIKTKKLRFHVTRMKPVLTDENKVARVAFAMNALRSDRKDRMVFENMYNVVHVDEKWFNHDKDVRKVILGANETMETRRCRNKRFIGKTMFLTAVARPR